MGLHEVGFIEKAAGFHVKDFRPHPFSDRVINRVAEDGRHEKERGHDFDLDELFPREGTDGEEERIAGQERGDDQAGFAKDDREEQDIDPDVVILDEPLEVAFGVQEKIDEVGECHARLLSRGGAAMANENPRCRKISPPARLSVVD